MAKTTPSCLIKALKQAFDRGVGLNEAIEVDIWESIKHDKESIQDIEQTAWQIYFEEIYFEETN
jgi:hypothetical protein